MNDYSFFSVPQLKRDPLGGDMTSMCVDLIVWAPMVAYVFFALRIAHQAQSELLPQSRDSFWLFKRDAFTENGWRLQKRALGLFVGFAPTAIILMVISVVVCPAL